MKLVPWTKAAASSSQAEDVVAELEAGALRGTWRSISPAPGEAAAAESWSRVALEHRSEVGHRELRTH